jgi:transposase
MVSSVMYRARWKQDISVDVEGMDADLRTMLDTQVGDLERRIESVIAQEETSAAKARLLRSIPGIGPVSAAMLIAEMPELGRITSGEAAAMTGLAPVPHDRGAMRGRRTIAGGRRSLRHVLFQAALAAACHNPVLKPVAQHLKMRGKPHKVVIFAIARRLATIANATLKTGVAWRQNLVTQTHLLARWRSRLALHKLNQLSTKPVAAQTSPVSPCCHYLSPALSYP